MAETKTTTGEPYRESLEIGPNSYRDGANCHPGGPAPGRPHRSMTSQGIKSAGQV